MKIIFALLFCSIVDLSSSQSRQGAWKRPEPRISAKKCQEYKQLIERKIIFGGTWGEDDDDDEFAIKEYSCDHFTELIVGGEETKAGEFPHMAAIGWMLRNGSVTFNCGGSLISERFVLSVAHCAAISGVPPKIARLGDQNLATKDDGARPADYLIIEIITHEDYDPFLKEHDIALFKLARNVTFDKQFIRPACLSQVKDYNGGVVATGWGKTGTHLDSSAELLKVGLSVVNSERCYSILEAEISADTINPGQICAAGDRKKDTCQGDSGGPIQVSHQDAVCVYDIIGLTSFGLPTCGQRVPSIYTRVYRYLDWIENHVWSNR